MSPSHQTIESTVQAARQMLAQVCLEIVTSGAQAQRRRTRNSQAILTTEAEQLLLAWIRVQFGDVAAPAEGLRT